MAQILQPRDPDYGPGILMNGLRRAFDSWRYQVLLVLPVTLITLPAFALVAAVLGALGMLSGGGVWGGVLIALPYVVAVGVLTVGSAEVLRLYSVDWSEFETQLQAGERSTQPAGPNYLRLGVLCLAGANFLTLISLIAALVAWVGTSFVWVAAGPVVAAGAVVAVFGFEARQVRDHQKSISAKGIDIGERAIRRLGSLSVHDQAALGDLAKVAQLLLVSAVSGRRTVS